MTDTGVVIRIENLSKQYRIGGPQVRYKTIRESLVKAIEAPFLRLLSVARGQSSVVPHEAIWALRDVSFEVKRGEVVGIIGRNGAGKTTLLKILSRITEPTEGYAEIHGRVGSLLEVGTGFHPELTGRENIYLNGAILGMRKAEIDCKFDEIVDFAEIERFIDTPVKRYSSGMYVRLAFAVAAHLEPEILVVDEVLAVGDAEFQKKCLGKMEEVSREGRTVLFVSHNMAAVAQLCSEAYLLNAGRIVTSGQPQAVIESYLHGMDDQLSLGSRHDRMGDGRAKMTDMYLLAGGKRTQVIRTGEDTEICIVYESQSVGTLRNVRFDIGIYSVFGGFLSGLFNQVGDGLFDHLSPKGRVHCKIPGTPLAPGHYELNVSMNLSGSCADYVQKAFGFDVVPGEDLGDSVPPEWFRNCVVLPHVWTVESLEM